MDEYEGKAAQKAFWAGFENAGFGRSTGNIRSAWNHYKLTDEFKRLNSPDQRDATIEQQAARIAELMQLDGKRAEKGSRKSLGAMNAKLRAKVGKLEREIASLTATVACTGASQIREVVTDSLMGMISGVTGMTPPANEPAPAFIQAAIDRAVDRIAALKAQPRSAAVPVSLSRAFITGESGVAGYRVVIKSETLEKMQQVHNWLACLNAPGECVAVDELDISAERNAMQRQRDDAIKQLARECDDTDSLIRILGLDPEQLRTDGGFLNIAKSRALLAQRGKAVES